MKIKSVDIMALHPREGAFFRPVICRVNTDDGLYGYGEAAISYGKGSPAAFGMVKDLAPMVIGMDPLDTEVIWDKLYRSNATFWGQNGGPIVFAGIAAIDVALWDIKGKYFNQPVYKLLGGKKRDKLRCYASQLQMGWNRYVQKPQTAAADYAEVAKIAVADGYNCVKADFFQVKPEGGFYETEQQTRLLPPWQLAVIEERIAATREAVGPNVDIIIENHSNTDAQSAIQIARMAEKYNIFYYEEPNTPTPKLTKYISENINMPLASGERIYSRWQYAPYFENCSLQVIQPDLGNCGGITEVKKICDMAYTFDVGVQIHVCSSPILKAAALHLEAVIPNFLIHEHHVVSINEVNRELCVHDYQPVGGYYSTPELPGIGNELSEFALSTADIVTVR
jgi:L-alanine-DL-glutamate epimerase-like enolase superfamily enzyme